MVTAASTDRAVPVIEAISASRSFDGTVALDGVSLKVMRGEIGALLGPTGAGKTTLLRILCGLLDPTDGAVRILGQDTRRSPRDLRQRIGLVPSGDRSFYLRLSGLENLAFFARLHGLPRRVAVERSLAVLENVGLTDAATRRVAAYSHGMQKRLSVARALLMRPDVMLIDEATHDLDPEGAKQVRQLISGLAEQGAAVLWATQRLDEIRSFADSVTLIDKGTVRFAGSVSQLIAHSLPQRYLLRVRNGAVSGKALEPTLQTALAGIGTISSVPDGDADDFVLSLDERTPVGDAFRVLLQANVQIYACSEEQSQIEDAFIRLTGPTGGLSR